MTLSLDDRLCLLFLLIFVTIIYLHHRGHFHLDLVSLLRGRHNVLLLTSGGVSRVLVPVVEAGVAHFWRHDPQQSPAVCDGGRRRRRRRRHRGDRGHSPLGQRRRRLTRVSVRSHSQQILRLGSSSPMNERRRPPPSSALLQNALLPGLSRTRSGRCRSL